MSSLQKLKDENEQLNAEAINLRLKLTIEDFKNEIEVRKQNSIQVVRKDTTPGELVITPGT